MDINRLSTGMRIAAAAALALLIIMFLPWFGIDQESATEQGAAFQEGASAEELEEAAAEVAELDDVAAGATSVDFNAWDSFGLIDIILLLIILTVLALAVLRATGNTVNLPVSTSVLIAALGILGTLLILYRLIDTPGVAFFDYGREFGVFLGLVAAAAIALGGWRAMQEEGKSFAGEADRLQDRYGDSGPGGSSGGTTGTAAPPPGPGTTGTTETPPPPGSQPPPPGGPTA